MVVFMDFKSIIPDVSGWKRIHDHYSKEKIEGMPKISVIIPTCNSGHLLESTIETFISQKNVDKELVIVDADSEDHTTAIIEKYHEHIARVYYVTYENYSLMINKGFSLATGGYVCFLMPGMLYLNQYCLCHIAGLALQDQFPDIVFSGTYLAWPDFSSLKDAIQKPINEINPEYVYFPFNKTWLKRGFLPTAPGSVWFKADYIRNIGGMRYNSRLLRKSLYDLFCRIAADKKARITSTYWSTTYSERLVEKKYLNQKDVLRSLTVTFRHYGFFNVLVWVFRNKPVKFASSFLSRMSSFFRE